MVCCGFGDCCGQRSGVYPGRGVLNEVKIYALNIGTSGIRLEGEDLRSVPSLLHALEMTEEV